MLNGRTLTRHLRFSFRVSKNPFHFIYHVVTKYENSFFRGWWRRAAINIIIITTFIVVIVFIVISVIIVAVIVIVNFIFFRFLTSKINIRITSFSCSYNITIVIFGG